MSDIVLPPNYVTTPAWVIDSAFSVDPPKRALLGSYSRLLSLAWNREDRSSPPLPESYFYDNDDAQGFLRVSRRQFYQVVSEMEGMRWLRSERPRAGFVQFFFHGSDPAGAENRTASAENRTVLKRIEEEESIALLKTKNPPPPSSEEPVRKIALQEIALVEGPRRTVLADDAHVAKMQSLIEHLTLVFDPQEHSVLEWREEFQVGIPERVLGWIAKAHKDGMGLGFVVKHIRAQDTPHRYFLQHAREILPEEYLEAVGEFDVECDYCTEHFPTRAAKDEHRKRAHANRCDDCGKDFEDAEQLKAHWNAEHDPFRVQTPELPDLPEPVLDGSIESTWQCVLRSLQMEMPRASFDTWVRDTRPVRYDGNTLTIGARNSYARDWLENRLAEKISQLAGAELKQTVQVVFVVDGATA